MTHRCLAARFEHAQEAVHVVGRVGERVAERVADAGLRRQVAYHVEALFRAEGRNRLGVRKVEAPEAQSRVGGVSLGTACFATGDPEFTQAVQLQLDVVVAVEVVDPEHAVAQLDHAAGQVEADETCNSGNESLHRSYYERSDASGQQGIRQRWNQSRSSDQPERLLPLVVAAGPLGFAVQADAAGAGAVVDPVPELGDGVDAGRL